MGEVKKISRRDCFMIGIAFLLLIFTTSKFREGLIEGAINDYIDKEETVGER